MKLLKYDYFCAQQPIIKAGNHTFQDLIDAPRTMTACAISFLNNNTAISTGGYQGKCKCSSQCNVLLSNNFIMANNSFEDKMDVSQDFTDRPRMLRKSKMCSLS